MFKKVIHIIIACLILVSTTGFTVNLHYCHDQLIDLALFSPAQSCCDAANEDPCENDNSLRKMDHCEDASIVAETIDDYVDSSLTEKLENDHSINLLFAASILFNIQGSDAENVKEAPWHKEPPPFQEVVLSHIQSYLI